MTSQVDGPPRPTQHHGIMTAPTTQSTTTAGSDYGSDIGYEDIEEDTLLADALDTINDARPTEKSAALPSIEFEEGEREDEDEDEQQHVGGLVQVHRPTLLRVAKDGVQGSAREVEYDERSRRSWSGMSRLAHVDSMERGRR
jgi:exonuclease V